MADDVGASLASSASRRVLVPRTPVPSRTSNVLMLVGLLWGIVVTLAAEGFLAAAGVPVTARSALRAVLLAIAWVPFLLGVFAGWLGRIPGLTWLIARTQPRLELDEVGLTIADEQGRTVRVPWSQVAQVRIQHPITRSPVIGPDGSVVARIPGALTTPRVDGGGETRLADEIGRFRPDLGQALWAQQHAALLVVLLVLAVATTALVIWAVSR